MPSSPPPSSALAATTESSTTLWQNDLKDLFDHAKERFPDVVWELIDEDERGLDEEVWGHKAIVYARAPPSFLAQYFDVRPAQQAASRLYTSSPAQNLIPPSQSTYSLRQETSPRTPSPYRHAQSPAPSASQGNSVLRISTTISPSLFSNQLEYLYTGRGIGAAFEFLFDTPDDVEGAADIEAARIDKLRKDLVFMWRSRLYSDVRISLTGNFAPEGDDGEEATAIFSSHRFVLSSRSPYFRSLFLSNSFAPAAPASALSPITVTLPSPPFTPASLHFTLGYIYTGTLFFSHRTFDLTTSFHIYRSAIYLTLPSLQLEIEARIVEEMMHGLFHAYLAFPEYESITGGRWGVGGCKCRSCARRMPRVLEFATSDDVKNSVLDRGARRGLVGIFGEGWVTPEFAGLQAKSRAQALKGVQARTTPQNVLPLLFAAETALIKLEKPGFGDQPWTELVHDLIMSERKKIDEILCASAEDVFEQEEWLAILERDAVKFEDGDHVSWVMDAIRRGLTDQNAPIIYQTLVNSILLRPHPSSANAHASTLLSSTSLVRTQVESARIDILRWLRKRWAGVRLVNGFDNLEGWALKEISDELDIPVDELIAQRNSPFKGDPTRVRSVADPAAEQAELDAESTSMTSLRASVLSRNASRHDRDSFASSRSSVRSSAASTSTVSRQPRANVASPLRTALSPSSASTLSRSTAASSSRTVSTQRTPNRQDTSNIPTESTTLGPPAGRPKSLAPSVASVRSTASSIRSTSTVSTLRKPRAPTTASQKPSTTASPSPLSRPTSRVSTNSAASTSFVTAPSVPAGSTTAPRTRTLSGASATSSVSTRSAGGPPSAHLAVPGQGTRTRRSSIASNSSAVSSSSKASAPRRRVAPTGASKPAAQRPTSQASVRSTISTTSTVAERRKMFQGGDATTSPAKKTPPRPTPPPVPSLPKSPLTPSPSTSKAAREVPSTPPHSSVPLTAPPSGLTTSPSSAVETPTSSPRKSKSGTSASESSTIRGHPSTPKRKTSTDTITASVASSSQPASTPRASIRSPDTYRPLSPLPTPTHTPPPRRSVTTSGRSSAAPPSHPRGVTLNIGIPCMISSKRSRFKAFARYIGEVEGELGPWIGVEVPVGESWGLDKLEGRQWHDGSLRGVRYFEIGSATDEGEERAARRRRLEYLADRTNLGGGGASPSTISLKKRERDGEFLSAEQERLKRLRSASPAISDMSGTTESRGLFIRPQQVLLVFDAKEQD